MDPLLIVSPHLDDAVLSVGQLMAGRPNCVVVTVFAGTPRRNRMLTTYDQGCGYISAGDAMRSRRHDDLSALGTLAARAEHLRFVDHQYRAEEPVDDPVLCGMIAGELARIVDDLGPSLHQALGPVGLAHPDHLLVASAFQLLLSMRRHLEPWLYEDLPSRVLWPEQVPARMDRWRDAGLEARLDFLGTGPLAAKEQALEHYASQHEALRVACGGNLYPALVPERLHRLWRNEP